MDAVEVGRAPLRRMWGPPPLPDVVARAACALTRSAGVRRSTWPEVAWRFSHLTGDGYPWSWPHHLRPACVTAEVAGPEVDPVRRLSPDLLPARRAPVPRISSPGLRLCRQVGRCVMAPGWAGATPRRVPPATATSFTSRSRPMPRRPPPSSPGGWGTCPIWRGVTSRCVCSAVTCGPAIWSCTYASTAWHAGRSSVVALPRFGGQPAPLLEVSKPRSVARPAISHRQRRAELRGGWRRAPAGPARLLLVLRHGRPARTGSPAAASDAGC